ncbi:MAG: PP0621 family protein [Advenella sp.]|nr:PP0621 family protein [Advenella sp.]
MRFFLFIVLIIILMLAIRMFAGRAQAFLKNIQAQANPNQPPAARHSQETESMVQCAHCHIHLPRSEACLINGKTWCSEDHARLGQK